MEFEGLVLWLQKHWHIQDNNGFHAISHSRVFGNLMLSAIKSMENCGGEYSESPMELILFRRDVLYLCRTTPAQNCSNGPTVVKVMPCVMKCLDSQD